MFVYDFEPGWKQAAEIKRWLELENRRLAAEQERREREWRDRTLMDLLHRPPYGPY